MHSVELEIECTVCKQAFNSLSMLKQHEKGKSIFVGNNIYLHRLNANILKLENQVLLFFKQLTLYSGKS